MIEEPDPEEGATELHQVTRAEHPPLAYRLSVVKGADAGKEFLIGADEPLRVFAGKSAACAVRLTDPSVSRRHVAFQAAGKRLRVTDLGSTNGTQINGVTVADAFLAGGERVELGGTVISVARGDAPKNDAPPTSAKAFELTYGESPQMRRLYPLIARIAASDVPVIIEGETGTGKEVLAESIHLASPRAARTFVVFDCTTVPANLMESELFGHEKGAFTGAASTRRGVFEQAEGGTLLIDEIGDLDLALQPKLLRAVERKEIRRLGGAAPIRVNVRLLAATRRDLDHEIAAGRFRDDLFHRLAVARVELPPLRDRHGDVRALVRRFCEESGADPETVPPALMAQWEDSPWPGNLRELRNAVLRWVALGDSAEPRVGPPTKADGKDGDVIESVLGLRLPFAEARQRVVADFEARYVQRVLSEHGGHVGHAAAASGIGRRYFHMLLARKRDAGS